MKVCVKYYPYILLSLEEFSSKKTKTKWIEMIN